ncbi:hypothetical protein [Burkholderia ambifaria]|uniref:hypothetical protein n=1 Tax=Burkholderia ambifaria TaxID=152480 RepID=UPI000F80B309|nr:hypothetical protein [Burkholderia ambifaria]UEP38972.1 hypothetical protein LL998_31975 [Burkholderia ambifaria]
MSFSQMSDNHLSFYSPNREHAKHHLGVFVANGWLPSARKRVAHTVVGSEQFLAARSAGRSDHRQARAAAPVSSQCIET